MSFDSFQTSGNSPGRNDQSRRIAILGFGAVGSPLARRLTDTIRIPGFDLASILDRMDRSKDRSLPGLLLLGTVDRSLQQHKSLVGAGLQTGPTFAEAV